MTLFIVYQQGAAIQTWYEAPVWVDKQGMDAQFTTWNINDAINQYLVFGDCFIRKKRVCIAIATARALG